MDISIFFCFLFSFYSQFLKTFIIILNLLANVYVNFLSHSLNWLYAFQSYLSEKGLVHRDLAARNILVGHGKKLKIGDFGLMREMYHELYEVKKQKKLPIKWMAPEAIYEQIFTSKSDVYVLFLTYKRAEYNTDFTCARNRKIPFIWVCVAAWGFLCVYGINII